ncbi:MAG: hypothetical protein ABW105_01830, partial [Candidatus Thiodiazotropha sp. 6PLUC1]
GILTLMVRQGRTLRFIIAYRVACPTHNKTISSNSSLMTSRSKSTRRVWPCRTMPNYNQTT